ncbi:hypothetical protein PpBr36_08141 [Pyricularia pennisetigena]|uniref:hypothetical protein n=1 Tax=Pyricularia pennisetigena TaxID=1578925 RepID=UPI001153A78B|nr:hypothetical protein PpBr36_08141 [Pyricularia pennisetigena]TLS24075.1 hypothetical protein PpBr36_08141 [Pyricularia pennisetigena]
MQPTQRLLMKGAFRKFRLTTKDANKGFYKGTGTGSMGRHTKHGGYIVEFDKVRTYVVPKNLDEFKLSPFVTKKMSPTFGLGSYQGQGQTGPRSPELYLSRWKAENGFD